MDGARLLASYLEGKKLSQTAFAASIGVEQNLVSRYLSGERRPGRDNAIAIQRETRGAVPAEAWSPHRRKPKRRSAA